MASINTNISAYYAQNNLRKAGDDAQTSIARLSSGNKITRASDDVSALSIGTILRTNVATLKTALTNTNQGSTLLQVADGALARVGEILQRQKSLATQANSGTLSSVEKGYLQQEFSSLSNELDRIVAKTNFNGVTLLDGNIEASGKIKAENATVVDDLVGVGTASISGIAFSVAGGVNNKVVGSLANATVEILHNATTDHTVSVNINGQTFTNASVDLMSAGAVVLTNSSGMTLTITTTAVPGTDNQAGVTALAEAIQKDLREGTLYQTRVLENNDAGYDINADALDGTILQGMSGANFRLVSDKFNADGETAPRIGSFEVTKYSSSADGSISVMIDGQKYTAALTGATIATGAALNFTTEADDQKGFRITFATTAATVNVDSDAAASAIKDALNKVFGSGSAGGLDFQVGTQSTDKISISLSAIDTKSLYKDNDGVVVSMDLVTGNLNDISDALDNAIKTVTARRADVGALQSRFNYAAATLETSIQNLDAARGSFLDADISEESTKFASAQVLQQAAISVLAQANQIPQNLLKLIG